MLCPINCYQDLLLWDTLEFLGYFRLRFHLPSLLSAIRLNISNELWFLIKLADAEYDEICYSLHPEASYKPCSGLYVHEKLSDYPGFPICQINMGDGEMLLIFCFEAVMYVHSKCSTILPNNFLKLQNILSIESRIHINFTSISQHRKFALAINRQRDPSLDDTCVRSGTNNPRSK